MLLVPYSSTKLTMLERRPVRIEAMAMTVVTPMTMPSTVRKLRNLCARTLSSAILNVSLGTNAVSFKASPSALAQCGYWIQLRRFQGRINTEHHPDNTGDRD